MKKIKIGYPVEGFSSKEEREAFRKKIMVIRGKTGESLRKRKNRLNKQ